MKRLFAVVLLSLIVALLCLSPVSVQATRPCASVTTLPATNITESTATLNGSVSVPSLVKNATPGGIIPASSQYATAPLQAVVSFQYGTTPGVYTNETPQVMLTQSGTFQAQITGLPTCTTHYARLKVSTILFKSFFEQYQYGIQGAGVGLDYKRMQHFFMPNGSDCPVTYGNVVSFDTLGCQTYIGTGSHGSGGMPGFGSTPPPSNPPIVGVSSAAVASTRVSPGEKVDVSATITNKGGSRGTSKVTLFINGQEEESKGITLSSGESTKMHFSVSRNDPGTYTAYVNSIPAGSFTVDQFKNNDALIYGVIALFVIGIAGILYLLIRKRTA